MTISSARAYQKFATDVDSRSNRRVVFSVQYRTLGSTGHNVSVIGIGTWQFGGEWGIDFEQATVDAILDTAASEGINYFDTAECYGDHLSEALIGDYLARRNRADWFVATKFGHKFHSFLNRDSALQSAQVQQQLEDSLRALRVEMIDLYQFHSGSDEAFENDALWDMLARQKQAGKIRHLGISIGAKAGSHQASRARDVGAEVLQVVYNRLDRRAETDFFPHAVRDNLGIMARVPLASGFLTGKFQAGHQFSVNDVRGTFEPSKVQNMLTQIEQIRESELPGDLPMSVWALAWCLKNETVTSVIPGCKSVDQVRQNASAAAVHIS